MNPVPARLPEPEGRGGLRPPSDAAGTSSEEHAP